jgi:hypothetical protein
LKRVAQLSNRTTHIEGHLFMTPHLTQIFPIVRSNDMQNGARNRSDKQAAESSLWFRISDLLRNV